MRGLWTNRTIVALHVLVCVVLIGLPSLWAFPSAGAGVDLANANLPPILFSASNPAFPLGTDDQGRCLLRTAVAAMGVSVVIAGGAAVFAALVGGCLGVLAASGGRWCDGLVMRCAELQLTFPAILTALVLQAAVGGWQVGQTSPVLPMLTISFAIGLAGWPDFAFGIRAIVKKELQLTFVDAARAGGVSATGIIVRHVLPATYGFARITIVWTAAQAVAIEASLSYLGLGMPPSIPSLGRMIHEGIPGLYAGEWWVVAVPMTVLFALSLALVAVHARSRPAP